MEDWLSGFSKLNPNTIESDDPKKAYSLNLFKEVLPALDRKDKFYYRKLTQEAKDSIEPWILMRWMVSPKSDKAQVHCLLSVNDLVNSNFSTLSPQKTLGKPGHKELQWMLLTLCGTGKFIERKFISPGKGAVKNKLESELLVHYPNLKDDDLELLLKINTKEDLIEFFKSNAYDDKTIKDLMKSYETGK